MIDTRNRSQRKCRNKRNCAQKWIFSIKFRSGLTQGLYFSFCFYWMGKQMERKVPQRAGNEGAGESSLNPSSVCVCESLCVYVCSCIWHMSMCVQYMQVCARAIALVEMCRVKRLIHFSISYFSTLLPESGAWSLTEPKLLHFSHTVWPQPQGPSCYCSPRLNLQGYTTPSLSYGYWGS